MIKIERPKVGDDTRAWGPTVSEDELGRDTSESAYFLCANRNKKSLAHGLRGRGTGLVGRWPRNAMC